MTRSFFRCLACGHVTPYRAGTRGIVAHNDRLHEGRGRFEQTEPAPGHAVLKRRYTDDWELVNLIGADIQVQGTAIGDHPWELGISWPDTTYLIHGEWRSQRTAEERRQQLRKIGRAGK